MASRTASFEGVAEAQGRAKKRLPISIYMALVAGSELGVTLRDTRPRRAGQESPDVLRRLWRMDDYAAADVGGRATAWTPRRGHAGAARRRRRRGRQMRDPVGRRRPARRCVVTANRRDPS
jgi:hypothetical protein